MGTLNTFAALGTVLSCYSRPPPPSPTTTTTIQLTNSIMTSTNDKDASATSKISSGKDVPPAVVVSPLPVTIPTTLSRSYNIHDVTTDAWVQLFADRIFVGVTQRNQKVGTYVMCQALKSPIDNAVDFTISTVLGDRDDAMAGVYARRVAERLIQERVSVTHMDPLNLFLGISLLDSGKDPKMFQSVVEILFQLIREALQNKSG